MSSIAVDNEEDVGPEISKQYSTNSKFALSKLDNLDGSFANMAKRVANLDKAIDPNNIDSIIAAKHDLAQIIGELDKLQCTEVNAIDNY